jgi:hypothetical protein
MTPEDKEWLTRHLEQRIEHLEKRMEEMLAKPFVTWPSLGTAILIGVGIATLLLTVYGGRS